MPLLYNYATIVTLCNQLSFAGIYCLLLFNKAYSEYLVHKINLQSSLHIETNMNLLTQFQFIKVLILPNTSLNKHDQLIIHIGSLKRFCYYS